MQKVIRGNKSRNWCLQVCSLYSKSFCLANLGWFLYQEYAHSKDECTEICYTVMGLTLETAGAQTTSKSSSSLQAAFTYHSYWNVFFQVTPPTALHHPAPPAETLTAWYPAAPSLSCDFFGMCDGAVGTGHFRKEGVASSHPMWCLQHLRTLAL